MQIHADVSNVTIHVPKATEAPCLGSAILGAVGAGLYPSIETAAEQMVTFTQTVTPDPETHAQYRFYADQYIKLYEDLGEWMHEVTEHALQRPAKGSGNQ